MKKSIYITFLSFIVCSCMGQQKKEENKKVNSSKSEWISLFDGKTTEGWHYFNGGKLGDEWTVDNGVLTFDPRNQEKDQNSDIVTDKSFNNFMLSIEWKIAECGNSGFFGEYMRMRSFLLHT